VSMNAIKYPFTILLSVLWLAGCSTTGPELPKVLRSGGSTVAYTADDFNGDQKLYRDAYKAAKTNEATIFRDSMIQRIRVEMDLTYHTFEGQLYDDRALLNTGSDWVELGLAGATTAFGGQTTKTALAAILTGFKGARLSFDKNWFREKTTETILSSMESERNKKLLLITGKMTASNAMQYTFDEALADLLDYFYAGTLQGALQTMSVQTGKAAADSKTEISDSTKKRIEMLQKAGLPEILTVEQLTDRLGELARAKDVTEATRILSALPTPITPKPGDDVFKLLQEQIRTLNPNDKTTIAAFAKAFKLTK